MSSNYRSGGGGGGGYRGRGGYGGFRGGRGGGFKPRRYWDRDDDDYHRRSRDRDRDRRDRRSRSRSDSPSDSRSRSRGRDRSDRGRERSRSRERSIDRERVRTSSPKRSPQYPPPANQFENPVMPAKEHFEPSYVPGSGSTIAQNSEIPSYMSQQSSLLTNSQNGNFSIPSQTQSQYPVADQYQHQQVQYQMANYQKQQQLQQAQVEAYKIVTGGQNAGGYNETAPLGFSIPQNQLPESLYQHQPNNIPPAPALSKMEQTTSGLLAPQVKKKKDLKKKKKRRKSSSSSSSSSSSDSSDEKSSSKRKQKSKSKRDSDDSSASSSDEENRDKGKPGQLTPQQKVALEQQADSYRKKLEIFEREIKRLRAKEDELALAKADMKLIEENLRLQGEIVGRCKAVNIVLEKINAVLHGGTMDSKPRPVPPPPPKISQHGSPQRQQVTLISSPPLRMDGTRPFDFFDNGLHWCRLCNVFPETVGEMLSHYHSPDHHAQVEQLGMDEKPWHKKNFIKETKPEPGAKKVPFRGIQFFTPVQGWYCRICSAWIGDPHCATEHLKSAEHFNNYSNFLEEHPDWEMKWMTDRDKARVRCGLSPGGGNRTEESAGLRPRGIKGGKYSFETDEAKGVGVRYQPGGKDFESDEYAKSIRVQMRNIAKENEARSYSEANLASSNMLLNSDKDNSVEEWMGKTNSQPVSLDIDTQKFAAIVRQKHGAKENETLAKKAEIPPPPPISRGRERDRDLRDGDSKRNNFDKRYESRVEMSFSGGRGDRERERDRDRDRERDRGGGRGGRRRSRSKSRDRSRDADRGRRRDRSRSRSSRERRPREGKEKEKEHQVRRLPIIGKMPLFKKPAKEAESSKDKAAEGEGVGEYGPVSTDGGKSEEVKATAAAAAAVIQASLAYAENEYAGYYDAATGYGYENYVAQQEVHVEVPPTPIYHQVLMQQLAEEMKPPGETAAAAAIPTAVAHPVSTSTGSTSTGPGGLPDDLQHALDIIYSGGGSKATTIPFPPPGVAAAQPSYDYSTGTYGGYGMEMGYDPYQHSFEGYVPVSEYGDAPPGVSETSAMNGSLETASGESKDGKSEANPEPAAQSESEPAAPGDDDFEDLRMLGIDVGDTAAAAVNIK